VELDKQKLSAALKAFDNLKDLGDTSLADAMRLQLGIGKSYSEQADIDLEYTNGEWLSAFKKGVSAEYSRIRSGKNFRAALRSYQQIGLNWLYHMEKLKFGALLADDMGLGKTVQILALLDYMREKSKGKTKTLLVIPASLLHNWQSEADRFAPKLAYKVIHTQSKDFRLEEADLFITTYGMLLRLDKFSDFEWDLLILDEAQAIKNPGNKQTKAAKNINAKYRIAMTGTPIENKLADLWSIFDFLNKGLLGNAREFSAFIKTLQDNALGYSRLRDIVSPFMLRRLKTDKSIISELPDKVELKAYTTLTKQQTLLYKNLVDDLADSLNKAEGISRKGLVLASIIKLKQICNHPDQYLGQKNFEEKLSGKFEKLREICETIYEKRERVLVFTQFKEIVAPLAEYLGVLFGREGLSLHGGTPVKERGKLVKAFNGEAYIPFMVLSIKAGGIGLNLTAANHVIHFDRWWNPAVENQATDRAFRIGQKKAVMVHKFVTAGTIEEKIDDLLETKRKLTEDIITSTGESWITEMTNEELMNLFALEV
jgi:non-specific serine/threonine protein kinase